MISLDVVCWDLSSYNHMTNASQPVLAAILKSKVTRPLPTVFGGFLSLLGQEAAQLLGI